MQIAELQRRTGERCDICRVGGGGVRLVMLDANGKQIKPAGKRPHATPHEKGAAVDMYFDGLSYRRVARNMEQYFGRETSQMAVYRWVRELTATADDVLRPVKVDTGREWVADEMVVNVGGQKMWLFNVMDADTRFVLAAHLTPERTARAAQTTLAMARERSNNAPAVVKTDGLRSYRQALPRAFPTRPVKHTVSQGIKAQINNNMSERLQGTFRDRDKTLVLRISGRQKRRERNYLSRIGRMSPLLRGKDDSPSRLTPRSSCLTGRNWGNSPPIPSNPAAPCLQ